MQNWIRLTKHLTQYSDHNKHKMAALIVRNGAVLSSATNRKQEGRHAEIRALPRNKDFSGATIIVMRKNGRCSRPCFSCLEAIRRAGITYIWFTNEAGRDDRKKVATMQSYKRMRRGNAVYN